MKTVTAEEFELNFDQMIKYVKKGETIAIVREKGGEIKAFMIPNEPGRNKG